MRGALLLPLILAACGGDDGGGGPDASLPDAQTSGGAVIFVNTAGGTYTQGPTNSRTNVSSIVAEDHDYGAWGTPAQHTALLAGLADFFAPFHVTITDEDPGDVPHLEAVMVAEADWPSVIAQDTVGGLSPFTCAPIDDAIVFVNPDMFATDFDIAWTTAQMIGNAAGLDHSFYCQDVMTFLASCGDDKSFVDMDVACGEFEARNCCTGSATQNSYQTLIDVFGAAP